MNGVVVITGATKGIGRSCAEIFMRKGRDVAVCARTFSDLENMKTELEAAYPGSVCHIYAVDMSSKVEVEGFARNVIALNQTVEALVNNAGVFIPGQIHNSPEGVLEETMEANLYSAFYLSRSLAPMLISQQSGHIFNMCSIASITAYPNGGAYSVSKFALYGLSKALREELKPFGIKVTAILPGATLTNSWAGTELPDSRFMQADDVAEVIWSAFNLSVGAVVEDIVLRPQLGDII